jgi:hypothetical protein
VSRTIRKQLNVSHEGGSKRRLGKIIQGGSSYLLVTKCKGCRIRGQNLTRKGEKGNAYSLWCGELKEINYLKDLGIDGRKLKC